jgi:hypothetical protein
MGENFAKPENHCAKIVLFNPIAVSTNFKWRLYNPT